MFGYTSSALASTFSVSAYGVIQRMQESVGPAASAVLGCVVQPVLKGPACLESSPNRQMQPHLRLWRPPTSETAAQLLGCCLEQDLVCDM